MKILFAHSFFMAFDEKQKLIRTPYPPLGTLIAAACARREGHEVALFDAMVAEDTADFEKMVLAEDFDVVVFFEDNFNWLSKMCLLRMREACVTMIQAARPRVQHILAAGSDASDFPEIYLKAGADYVIKGEAEFRVLEILAAEEHPVMLPGIFRLHNDKPAGQAPIRGERNLSVFPMAAWDLVDVEHYRRIWLRNHGWFSLNMVTTRGCPYRCNWCAKPVHGRRYDVRDPLEVAAEVAWLKDRFKPDHLWFADDIFGLKPGWTRRFAEEIRRLDAVIPFKIQARADLMSAAAAADLAAAGCRTVWMGVESGSQSVLDAMDKDLKVPAIKEAVANLKREDIRACFFLQFGYPGETAADIRATWEMIRETRPHEIGISVAYPLPDTPFYERVKDQLHDQDHWLTSNDMKPIFQATYPADFYPQLYRYIHQKFVALNDPRHPLSPVGIKRFLRRLQTSRDLKRFGVEGIPFS
ncbi:MAG: radical SAM protein [Acidobacteriota bacterium]|nr:radical SAM protein [Acidobacteriota bacterium]